MAWISRQISHLLFIDGIAKLIRILSFQINKGQPDHGWSSSDVSEHLKCKCYL